MAWHAITAVVILAVLAIGSVAPGAPEPVWSPRIGTAQVPDHVLTPAQAAGLPPTVQGGIGPGSALQMGVGGIQSVCTAAFLLRDPLAGTYYLSTAGHCLVRNLDQPEPVDGRSAQDKVKDRIDICIAGCVSNGLALGTYVKLTPSGDYHPVAYAISGGVGKDFGLIELPAELHGQLRPEMPQWGGPTGVAASASDESDFVVHYGHGALCCPGLFALVTRTPADQGRVALFAGSAASSWEAFGSSSGGDSGSGVSFGNPGADLASGTKALGVLTHGSYVAHPAASVPIFTGTLLTHGFGLVRGHLALELELVAAGDALPQGPTREPPVPPTVDLTVSSPTDGATLSTAGKRVRIAGSTAVSNGSLPADAQVQVAIDDAAFGTDSRVPVSGNASWSGTWDLAGVPVGKHIVRARVVDGAGIVLDQHNVTVTLQSGNAPSPSSSSAPRASTSTTGAPSAQAPGDGPNDGRRGAVDVTRGAPGLGLGLAVAVLAAAIVVVRRRA